MAKLYTFLAATTLIMLIAAGPAVAGTFPPFPPGHCAAGSCFGTSAGDAVFGGPGKDTVEGNRGDDKVEGGRGSDQVNGGEGSDKVVGNKGNDRLLGGAGRDHVDGQDLGRAGIGGSDVLDCGPGFDTFEADFDDTVMPNCEKGVVGGS